MKLRTRYIQIVTGILVSCFFSGCVKKDEITSDAFLFTMLSATIDNGNNAEGVTVNLRIYLEAGEETPIDSFSVWVSYAEGEFDPGDPNNIKKETRTGNPGPGYFIFPVNLQLADFRNFALCAYSKGVLYKTRAVNLAQLLKSTYLGEVAYYKFDGNFHDEYGNYNLDDIGTTALVQGYKSTTGDQAVSFINGSLKHDFLDYTVGSSIGRTFSFKVYYTGGSPYLFAYGDDGAGEFSARISEANAAIIVKVGNNNFSLCAGSVTPNIWHKIVVRVPANSTENRVLACVDGNAESATGTLPVSTLIGNGFHIGAGPLGASSANNLIIDDFRIWDRALSLLAVKVLTGD